MTWIKARGLSGEEPTIFNTSTQYGIGTNTTAYNTRDKTYFWDVNSSGFTFPIGSAGNPVINQDAANYASWTFREAPGFFDIVTYTGNGSTGQNIAHDLGVAPGMIITKAIDSSAYNWDVYHRSLGATKSMHLNLTDPAYTGTYFWNDTEPTSTQFTVKNSGGSNGN